MSYSDKTNHAWNVVTLSGEWRLVDCTWDAGHIDGKNFFKHEGESYFLSDPEVFVIDHLPCMKGNDTHTNEKWQLLTKPWPIEKFSKHVKLEKNFHKYELQISENETLVNVNKELDIILSELGTPLSSISASLTTTDGTKHNQFLLMSLMAPTKVRIHLRPPFAGTFDLCIYGNRGEGKDLQALVKYVIRCNDVCSDVRPYPENYGLWGLDKADHSVPQPKFNFIAERGEVKINLEVAAEMELTNRLYFSDKSLQQENAGSIYTERVGKSCTFIARLIKEGYYKLTIFAKYSNSTDETYHPYTHLLIDCKAPFQPYCKFLKMYPSAMSMDVQLMEPRNADLPANSMIDLKFVSSKVQRVMITKTVHTQPNESARQWDLVIPTGDPGTDVIVFGSTEESGSLNAMFKYSVV